MDTLKSIIRPTVFTSIDRITLFAIEETLDKFPVFPVSNFEAVETKRDLIRANDASRRAANALLWNRGHGIDSISQLWKSLFTLFVYTSDQSSLVSLALLP